MSPSIPQAWPSYGLTAGLSKPRKATLPSLGRHRAGPGRTQGEKEIPPNATDLPRESDSKVVASASQAVSYWGTWFLCKTEGGMQLRVGATWKGVTSGPARSLNFVFQC